MERYHHQRERLHLWQVLQRQGRLHLWTASAARLTQLKMYLYENTENATLSTNSAGNLRDSMRSVMVCLLMVRGTRWTNMVSYVCRNSATNTYPHCPLSTSTIPNCISLNAALSIGIRKLGRTHLTLEILRHRPQFESNFREAYNRTFDDLRVCRP